MHLLYACERGTNFYTSYMKGLPFQSQIVYNCFDKGCPTKAHAAMPIGIMGTKELGVDWLRFTAFTNKKREGINSFVCAVSLFVTGTPNASIKDMNPSNL